MLDEQTGRWLAYAFVGMCVVGGAICFGLGFFAKWLMERGQ